MGSLRDRRRAYALLVCLAASAATPWFYSLVAESPVPLELRVDLSERRLEVRRGGELVESYGVAVGRPGHPTPTGTFTTGRIEWNPRWVPPPREWARKLKPRAGGDPRNPMQGVKIYFREPWYFIHGTNNPESIGSAASHGCLRMRTAEAKALARLIERNGGTATLVIRS